MPCEDFSEIRDSSVTAKPGRSGRGSGGKKIRQISCSRANACIRETRPSASSSRGIHVHQSMRTILLLSLLTDVRCLHYLGPSRGFFFHMLDELFWRRGRDVDPLLLKPSSECGFLQQVNKI